VILEGFVVFVPERHILNEYGRPPGSILQAAPPPPPKQ
jgi:hypothetical protein